MIKIIVISFIMLALSILSANLGFAFGVYFFGVLFVFCPSCSLLVMFLKDRRRNG